MANIMINKTCNLKCPYCFANEFVNKFDQNHVGINDITLENFKVAVDFITRTEPHIGIIGGEPTLHRHFKEIMEELIYNPRVETVTLYTNGVYLDKYAPILSHRKIGMLVNCNTPEVMGEGQYKKLIASLDKMIFEYYKGDQLTLGINMFGENFEYDYIIDLLKKYNMKHVRTSIVVPNTDDKRNNNSLQYFRKMKPRVMQFFRELYSLGIVPTYDCNQMPICVYSKEDLDFIHAFTQLPTFNPMIKFNLAEGSACSPVIDILQDLTAVRCFGMSEYEKVNILDYNDLNEIRMHFTLSQDNYSRMIPIDEECKSCKLFGIGCCMQGCIAFKRNKITQIKERVQDLL